MNSMTLKFIADESCDFALVRGLRSAGHDVTAIAEIIPGTVDLKVLEKAAQENRILLTEDKDFGEWVFAHGKSTAGILLVRYPANIRITMTQAIVDLVSEHGEELLNSYTVLEPGRARIRKIW